MIRIRLSVLKWPSKSFNGSQPLRDEEVTGEASRLKPEDQRSQEACTLFTSPTALQKQHTCCLSLKEVPPLGLEAGRERALRVPIQA